MLTDLKFLNKGAKFPPDDKDTTARLKMYEYNKRIFENEHADVYRKQFERIERVIGNFQQIISYPVVLNYQKLISKKVADLLFGEAPQFGAADPDNKAQDDRVNEIVDNTDLINTGYESSIDISRFGDGILRPYLATSGATIGTVPPRIWFPVVNADNIKERLYDVLAWEYTVQREDGSEKTYLKVMIFNDSENVEKREYELVTNLNKYSEIGDMISSSIEQTGLKANPIIQIPNIITSDRATGIDDYSDVDSILSELMVRVAQISRVLDKHASPSVTGPTTSLEQDKDTGEWRLKLGNYFPRNTNDEPKVEYLVWEGELTASFTQCDRLLNHLYTISEMGSALLGDFSNTASGQVPSGTAMRRMMMSPLAKVNRIRMRFDLQLRKLIAYVSQLDGGLALEPEDVAINWQDGLPADPKEQVEIEKMRVSDKATSSVRSAIKRLDDADDEKADQEYKDILTDEGAIIDEF